MFFMCGTMIFMLYDHVFHVVYHVLIPYDHDFDVWYHEFISYDHEFDVWYYDLIPNDLDIDVWYTMFWYLMTMFLPCGTMNFTPDDHVYHVVPHDFGTLYHDFHAIWPCFSCGTPWFWPIMPPYDMN